MTLPHDRQVAAWLTDDAHEPPPESLARALAATRRTRKRPRWTFPERWIPMQLTMAPTSQMRPFLTIATLALMLVALVATALFIGARQPAPTLYRNGAIVFEQGGRLFIADQPDGAARLLVSGFRPDASPVFSPQGDRIAFTRGTEDRTVMTVRTDGSEVRELAQLPSGPLQLDWSPDGRTVIASFDGLYVDAHFDEVFLIASDGSGARPLETGVNGRSGLADWRPDGRHIALAVRPQQTAVVVLAAADGADAEVIWSSSSHTAGLAWSPDGTRLAMSDPLGPTVTVVDVDAGGDVTASHESTVDPMATSVPGPSWSPDGRQLAVMLESGRVEIITADGSDHRIVGPILDPTIGDPGVTWSPDGRTLVVTGGALRDDPVTGTPRWAETSWKIDVATGAHTEAATPVDAWQRLAP